MDSRGFDLSRRTFFGLSFSIASAGVARAAMRTSADPGGPSAAATVRPALATQEDLIEKKEHCSADQALLTSIGRAKGQQVRIYRGDDQFAIFTVHEIDAGGPASSIRMGLVGRARLDGPTNFAATIVATAPHPTLDDAAAKAAGEFVERLDREAGKSWLLAMAPHGGGIEPHTDQQAERLAAKLAGKGVASWRCKGWHPKGTAAAFERWHITSTDINEASFPLLASVGPGLFENAVAFHGMSDPGVLIGGGASATFKQAVQAELVRVLAGTGLTVRIAANGQSLGGSSAKNIVNRFCQGNGLQIEQSSIARLDHWQDIADAVATVYGMGPK